MKHARHAEGRGGPMILSGTRASGAVRSARRDGIALKNDGQASDNRHVGPGTGPIVLESATRAAPSGATPTRGQRLIARVVRRPQRVQGVTTMLFGKKQIARGAGHRKPHDQGGGARGSVEQDLSPRPLGHLAAARRSDRGRRDHGPAARRPTRSRTCSTRAASRSRQVVAAVSGRAVIVKKIPMNKLSRRGRQAGGLLGGRAARALRHQRRLARLRDPGAGAQRPEADAGAAGRGQEGHGAVVQRPDPRGRAARR